VSVSENYIDFLRFKGDSESGFARLEEKDFTPKEVWIKTHEMLESAVLYNSPLKLVIERRREKDKDSEKIHFVDYLVRVAEI